MTAGQLLDAMSSAELTEWMAFGEFEEQEGTREPGAPRHDRAKLTGGL